MLDSYRAHSRENGRMESELSNSGSQSRASISGHQTSVRSCESALSRAVQKYRTTGDVIRAVEFMDDAKNVIERNGRINPSG